MASDCKENILIADSGNGRIRRVDAASGVIATVAGGGAPANGLNAVEARLRPPRDLAFDRAGNLLVVDTADHRIRAVSRIAAPAPSAGGGAPGPCSAP